MTDLHVRLSGRVGALPIAAAFTAPPGVTAIVGPSGAGKTTLLRAVTGLERLAGDVRLGDAVWQSEAAFVPPERRRIGMVFQGANLLPHLSVRANLAYAARRAEAPIPIEQIADRVGVTALLDRAVSLLSGGEAQRVAFARALLIRPKLLLLDEPFSGLDGAACGGVIDLLADLAMPAVIVTHDPDGIEAVTRSTRRMIDGVLQ